LWVPYVCPVKERDHERKSIEQYVLSQDHSVEVTHSQRITSTKVGGTSHEIWDVHTTGSRYWVITNPTNLYDQESHTSYDQTLSFHVGLSARIFDKQRTELPDEAEGVVEVAWRKFQRALDAFDKADEAEDFQAIGVHCREALIALALHFRSILTDVTLSSPPPKESDFKGWAYLAADYLARGRLRSYLKVLAENAWDLAVWLQHYTKATRWDAELVIDAVSNVTASFGVAIRRHENGEPTKCPNCFSYRVDEDVDIDEEDNDVVHCRLVCVACEHEWDHRSRRWDDVARKWTDL
jgi:hypothetical protein